MRQPPKPSRFLNVQKVAHLLVDEAYQLMPLDATRDFGKECIEKLMEAIEGGPATNSRILLKIFPFKRFQKFLPLCLAKRLQNFAL